MKIATWNVNSLNVRLPHVEAWLDAQKPDVLALQETKMVDEKFPHQKLAELGYHSSFIGQPKYNGVALLSPHAASDVVTAPPGVESEERRIIAATYGKLRVVNLYVVNGKEVDDEKYHFKLQWLRQVHAWLVEEYQRHEHLVVVGDFNIAPSDADVHDPVAWADKILCSVPERQALQDILDLGMEDCFRRFEQAEKSFSWWDYRQGGFRRNQGLRIDLILASTALAQRCLSCVIDREPRAWERPSDHTPVVAEFDV